MSESERARARERTGGKERGGKGKRGIEEEMEGRGRCEKPRNKKRQKDRASQGTREQKNGVAVNGNAGISNSLPHLSLPPSLLSFYPFSLCVASQVIAHLLQVLGILQSVSGDIRRATELQNDSSEPTAYHPLTLLLLSKLSSS